MFTAFAVSLLLPPAPMPREKPNSVREAVSRSLPKLAAGAEGHAEQKSCFACHNQAFPMMAFTVAKTRGFDVPESLFKGQTVHVAGFLSENKEKFQKGL